MSPMNRLIARSAFTGIILLAFLIFLIAKGVCISSEIAPFQENWPFFMILGAIAGAFIFYLILWSRKILYFSLLAKHFQDHSPEQIPLFLAGEFKNLIRQKEQYLELKKQTRTQETVREKTALLENWISEGIYDWDIQKKTVYFSKQWKAMLGYEDHEVMDNDRWWKDLIHPEDKNRFNEELQSALTGSTDSFESSFRMRKKDQSYQWILSRGKIFRNPEKKAVRMVGVHINQDKIKETEKLLKESLQNYKNLANSSRALIWTSGTDGLCDYFNETWLQFSGRTFEQEKGNGWAEGVHAEDFQQCLEIYLTSFKNQKKFSMEYRLRRHDGVYRWILDEGNPRYDSDGNFLGYIGYCTDVTERREREEALRSSEEKFRNLFENMNDGFAYHELITDESGEPTDYRFLEMNHGFETLTGLSASEIKGKTLTEVFPGILEKDRKWLRIYGEVALTGKKVRFDEYAVYQKKWFHVYAFSTKKGYFATVFEDITEKKDEQKKLEENQRMLEEQVKERTRQLEETNRELEAFSYTVSHDLRAPLRNIRGFSKSLVEKLGEQLNEEGLDLLNRVQKSARHMETLMDELLNLSRVDRAGFVPKGMNLAHLAKQIAKEIDESNPDRQIRWKIPDSLPTWGDETLLRILLQNLMDNAAKFTRNTPTAEIELGSRNKQGKTIFYLQDNGAGFDMRYSYRLFNPFQRLHKDSEFEGTGIGLATVRRIIARHGGTIHAESSPGQGAVFYFDLGEGHSTT